MLNCAWLLLGLPTVEPAVCLLPKSRLQHGTKQAQAEVKQGSEHLVSCINVGQTAASSLQASVPTHLSLLLKVGLSGCPPEGWPVSPTDSNLVEDRGMSIQYFCRIHPPSIGEGCCAGVTCSSSYATDERCRYRTDSQLYTSKEHSKRCCRSTRLKSLLFDCMPVALYGCHFILLSAVLNELQAGFTRSQYLCGAFTRS